MSATAEHVPLAQLSSVSEVTYEDPLVSLSLSVGPSAGTRIVKAQPPVIVTLTVPPVEPVEGEGAHEPPIVQVNEGAPASATVTSIGTVTDAAEAGCTGERKTTRKTATPTRKIGLLFKWKPTAPGVERGGVVI